MEREDSGCPTGSHQLHPRLAVSPHLTPKPAQPPARCIQCKAAQALLRTDPSSVKAVGKELWPPHLGDVDLSWKQEEEEQSPIHQDRTLQLMSLG